MTLEHIDRNIEPSPKPSDAARPRASTLEETIDSISKELIGSSTFPPTPPLSTKPDTDPSIPSIIHYDARRLSKIDYPELHVQTGVSDTTATNPSAQSIPIPQKRASPGPLSRSNSNKSLSPNSVGSPNLSGFLGTITPLPSPLVEKDSPGPWHTLGRSGSRSSRPESRGGGTALMRDSAWSNMGSDGTMLNLSPPQLHFHQKHVSRKLYNGITPVPLEISLKGDGTTASRSISEQHSSKLSVPNHENQIVQDEQDSIKDSKAGDCTQLRREQFLAGKHGYPKSTNLAKPMLEENKVVHTEEQPKDIEEPTSQGDFETYEANTYPGNKRKRWKGMKQLGQGTFSNVILAEQQNIEDDTPKKGKRLVAIKIVEHTAAGGASATRIESSLKRELDILKSIRHPSLVHLKAFNVELKRALLVLTYCPGGDLFEFATSRMDLLQPKLVRRIFAELVGALQYLHKHAIVHRDVKLENVLLNLDADELANLSDPLHHKRSIITLTDLGLSRRIDLENPMLTTRCGSEDYAAPEILLAQPYDGRQTDTWALGVLLYALMESRLPFDPMPGTAEHKMRSRTALKIAKCDWKWVKLADVPKSTIEKDGVVNGDCGREDWDRGWEPAKVIVEGMLKRVKKRTSLCEVAAMEWVTGAIVDDLEQPYLLDDDE